MSTTILEQRDTTAAPPSIARTLALDATVPVILLASAARTHGSGD
jgi:hypothetical protein